MNSQESFEISQEDACIRLRWLKITILLYFLPLLELAIDWINCAISSSSLCEVFHNLFPSIILRSIAVPLGFALLYHCAYKKCGNRLLTLMMIAMPFGILGDVFELQKMDLSLFSAFVAGGIFGVSVALKLWWMGLSFNLRKINRQIRLARSNGCPTHRSFAQWIFSKRKGLLFSLLIAFSLLLSLSLLHGCSENAPTSSKSTNKTATKDASLPFTKKEPSRSKVAAKGGSMKKANLFVNLVEKVSQSMVSIVTKRKPSSQGQWEGYDDYGYFYLCSDHHSANHSTSYNTGSGFFISEDAYIATNWHVICGAEAVTVELCDGTEYPAAIIGADIQRDIAVLKITTNSSLKPLKWGDSDRVKRGQSVAAIGDPFGYRASVSTGVISSEERYAMYLCTKLLQVDLVSNPGNSGGPLLNTKGEVIGIMVGGNRGNDPTNIGINFAIASNVARASIRSILEGKPIHFGYLGVLFQSVDSDIVDFFDLNFYKGALIGYVFPGSPAEKAGLLPGDLLLAIDNVPIRKISQAVSLIGLSPSEKKCILTIKRLSQTMTCEVTLSAIPGYSNELYEAMSDEGLSFYPWKLSGAQEVTGLKVVAIDKESSVYASGIRLGDVILSVNKQPVHSEEEYLQAIKEAKEKESVTYQVWQGDFIKIVNVKRS